MTTIWVQALTTDRKVILSEYDPAHPGDRHEAWIVGYPDRNEDSGEPRTGNVPIEVGDTALVRQRIAEKVLVEVASPMAKQSAAPKTPTSPKEPAT